MTDLQAQVAAAADRAGTHSTAPALLLQLQAALGVLAATADRATEGGRRPYRVSDDWAAQLSELAYLSYLLADQTGVSIETEVLALAARRNTAASGDADTIETQRDWI